jgi:membrane protein YdbS with pleckstrin-like domain
MTDIFVSELKKTAPENSTVPDKAAPSVPAGVPVTESPRPVVSSHNHSHLSSFRLYPEDVEFETKENDEKIILLLRAHPITNIGWILIAILMFFVPGIARTLGVFNSLPSGFGLVISLVWYLITTAYVLESFLGWYFNVYFVTNLRVIDVDFYNLIYKQVSDANIDKIQDVSYNMGGVIRTIFNFGNVFIQTAAKVEEFDFLAIPNPDKVAKIIEDMITKDEQKEVDEENT